MKNSFWLILPAVILVACSDHAQWNTGNEVTRKMELDTFQTVEVNGVFDILLVQDSLNYVLVTCGENIHELVGISTGNGILKLDRRSVMNWTSSYRHTLIELHFTSLTTVQIFSSIKIGSADTIRCQEFAVEDYSLMSELNLMVNCDFFRLSVPGDNFGLYTVSGKAEKTVFHIGGSAHFRTKDLVTNSCDFIHTGIGDCYINAKKYIKGEITRKGRVYYKDYPMLSLQIENKNGRIFIIGG